MLIALLIALGVDLIIVVVFAALVLGRRRWPTTDSSPGRQAGLVKERGG
jgi:hypothetical protein